MNYRDLFDLWLSQEKLDSELKDELKNIASDEDEKEDRFYKELSFGTSGIRGKMGAGTNRINVHAVKRATQGLSDHLLETGKKPGAAIAYDTRKNSKTFAQAAADVLAANGIDVYIFAEVTPVAALSFAVRELDLSFGIMITASHNPKIYNGYKVYDENGCQITDEIAEAIYKKIARLDYFEDIKDEPGNEAKEKHIKRIPDDILQRYIDKAVEFSVPAAGMDNLRIIYTPLNGSGNRFVKTALKKAGIAEGNLIAVPEQDYPDGDFTTCPIPNPEEITVFTEALKIGEKTDFDIILATDPDCDRVGLCVNRKNGEVWFPTGNQVAIMLLQYICEKREEIKGGVVVRSIVSSALVDRIAEKYGLMTQTTLTGFKYIGKKMDRIGSDFVFGFEEGNGYLAATHVRDKDAVSAAVLIAQMAAYYKSKGKDLYEVLYDIYEEFGYCREESLSFVFEGKKGAEKMRRVMDHLRKEHKEHLVKKVEVVDYSEGIDDLPRSNVLEFRLGENQKFIVRPSGTEPKIKAYTFARGANKAEVLEDLEMERKIIEGIINEE